MSSVSSISGLSSYIAPTSLFGVAGLLDVVRVFDVIRVFYFVVSVSGHDERVGVDCISRVVMAFGLGRRLVV